MTEITVITDVDYVYQLWFEDGRYVGHDDQIGALDFVRYGEVRFVKHEVADPDTIADLYGVDTLAEALEGLTND